MGFRRSFALGLALRLAAAVGLLLLLVQSFGQPGYVALHIVLAFAALGACWELWRYVGRTNRAVARFVEAIRFDDFAQRFSLGDGTGFDELGAALDKAIVELGRRRMEAADEVRFLSGVVDDSPVALLMIDDGDRVTLLNKASRRQFGSIDGARISDFQRFGGEFQASLALDAPGRRVTRIVQDGPPQRVLLASAKVERLGEDRRIVSVLPVQNMLGSAEMAAQSDLVRVLTHEIMNSLTPVTSLARTASDLLASASPGDLDDARAAIDTVARRAEGLHRFVESYRAFASVPEVRRRTFEVKPWADEIARLFAADPAGAGVELRPEVAEGMSIDGDPELLAQLCLNLLRNGAAAASGHAASPTLGFAVRPGRDGRPLIEVTDNGPGIPPEKREDIFLPFFTTRVQGSGVGLSFVRQVAVAHGGAVAVGDAPGGGARFSVRLA